MLEINVIGDFFQLFSQGGKMEAEELMPAPASTTSPALSASIISRNILRKARLNLNKTTLQKIRNPASLQRLIPLCDEGEFSSSTVWIFSAVSVWSALTFRATELR